jgi:hypothetical protein
MPPTTNWWRAGEENSTAKNAKGAKTSRASSKHEIRSTKQYQMTKTQKNFEQGSIGFKLLASDSHSVILNEA